MHIDINCDMGEGMANDEVLMPHITSANIACGYHAGGEALIRKTIDLALRHSVYIGVHPSFRDKVNFGRREMDIPPEELYALLIQQFVKVDLVAREKKAILHHVKLHGALYNMAARDRNMARVIATAVKDFNDDLILYGLSGSYLITEAQAIGLSTASEVFADRTYQDDGSLTPRSQPGALIEDPARSVEQVQQMVNEGCVTTLSGRRIPITAQTVCIHSDGRHAVEIAKALCSLGVMS
ncbi:MAG TPA: 5-oxoprolinase subunit PxpA [Flavisolibacter sp.]|jgi:UPF0271 protein